jgi:predicted RNA-binding protein
MSYMCGSEMVEAERGAAIKVKRRISYEEGYS